MTSSPAHIRGTVEDLKRVHRRAGRAGRSPTTTSSAWLAAGAAADAVAAHRDAIVGAGRVAARLGVRIPGRGTGLGEADVPYEALRDPYGIAFWPTFKGRDGCRTPMPWDASERAGFSNGEPWLPVPEQHSRSSVAAQERDPTSALHGFRRLLDVAQVASAC